VSIFDPLFDEDRQSWQGWLLVGGGSIAFCAILVLAAGRMSQVPQVALRDAGTGAEIVEPGRALVIEAFRKAGEARPHGATLLLVQGSRGFILAESAKDELIDLYVLHPAYLPAIVEDVKPGAEVVLQRGTGWSIDGRFRDLGRLSPRIAKAIAEHDGSAPDCCALGR
jgi:hypothetical protein